MDNTTKNRLNDMLRRNIERNIFLHTSFLDPLTQFESEGLCKSKSANYTFFGGYPEAERKILFLMRDDYCEESGCEIYAYAEDTISAVKISWRGTASVSHRDVLGSVLALGLQRNCIGDIIFPDLNSAIIFSTKAVSSLIAAIERVGKLPVNACLLSPDALQISSSDDGQSVTVNVAALRLDSVISTALSIPRGKSAALIEAGQVQVNWRVVLDKGKSLKEDDVLSIRRHGRIKLKSITGQSKKGQLFVLLEVWK